MTRDILVCRMQGPLLECRQALSQDSEGWRPIHLGIANRREGLETH